MGRRLLRMAEKKGLTRRIVVANKVGGEEDIALIRDLLGVDPGLSSRMKRPHVPPTARVRHRSTTTLCRQRWSLPDLASSLV